MTKKHVNLPSMLKSKKVIKNCIFQMTIIYSCIARGSAILCSHQIGAGNYEQAAESVLANLPTRNDGKTTITAARYSCSY